MKILERGTWFSEIWLLLISWWIQTSNRWSTRSKLTATMSPKMMTRNSRPTSGMTLIARKATWTFFRKMSLRKRTKGLIRRRWRHRNGADKPTHMTKVEMTGLAFQCIQLLMTHKHLSSSPTRKSLKSSRSYINRLKRHKNFCTSLELLMGSRKEQLKRSMWIVISR